MIHVSQLLVRLLRCRLQLGASSRFLMPAWCGVVALLVFAVVGGRVGWSWHARVFDPAVLLDLSLRNARLTIENAGYRTSAGELLRDVEALGAAVADPAVSPSVPSDVTSVVSGVTAVLDTLDAGTVAPSTAGRVVERLWPAVHSLRRRLAGLTFPQHPSTDLADLLPRVWPVSGTLTSPFGRRLDPITGRSALHAGIDIAARSGEPVVATASGVVLTAARTGSYGNLVEIAHRGGVTTRYGHLSVVVVRPGRRVVRGERIGLAGRTGRATGNHVHYEVRLRGRPVDPLRPLGLADSPAR